MTNELFWDMIAKSKSASDGDMDAQAEELRRQLSHLSAEEIVDFERVFGEYADRAYRWDLWGAAYIIGGGCSDDGFTDFRSWLISMGRVVYEEAIANPDSLAEINLGPDAEEDTFFEEFAYIACEAYENKTGSEMPDPQRSYSSDPAGDPWEEDGDDLQRRFPKLWAKYGEA
ncbi:DUF4240 domain-containing protein [Stratiformator vulcanicus]|uniref:DUF4240 domain-containing protein n=1 Tax=Stratiformator vulcanicus TaxID=2527980 RepID=A0A517R410_9PLAN|nr:DUF4240 domain-containing protein [Stratiformator vulcanicus]QDT38618.1 hypothetical protein Pan189_30130 [Stratiformator vulcanicus]